MQGMAELGCDVAVLLDKLAITELLTGYPRAIDQGDIATLLTHPRAVGTHTLHGAKFSGDVVYDDSWRSSTVDGLVR